MNHLIIAETLSYNNPTIVTHNCERLVLNHVSIENMVKAWRIKWLIGSEEWIVLALPRRTYKAIQKGVTPSSKSVERLFNEQHVLCIDYEDILDMCVAPDIDYEEFVKEHSCVGNCAKEGISCSECIRKDLEKLGVGDIRKASEKAVQEFANICEDSCTFDGHRVALSKNEIKRILNNSDKKKELSKRESDVNELMGLLSLYTPINCNHRKLANAILDAGYTMKD